MKKTVFAIFIFVILFSLVSCDISHLCSLDVICANENASIIADGESVKSLNFSSEELNRQPLENYSNIDFTVPENDNSNAKIYKFEVTSSKADTYNLSMELVDKNRYVIDFLRVGIVIDGELCVYKDYDKFEDLYQNDADDPETLSFKSGSTIFDDLSISLSADESKEITVFVWIEEAELYDRNGKRYTGWEDKSHKASPILLSLELK